MICVGIDAGSRAIKAVLVKSDTLEILARCVNDQGVQQDSLARELFEELLDKVAMTSKDVKRIVATGYGRNIVSFADTTITEITCHAVGVRSVVPDAMTIVDIGGQDSKLIRLTGNGGVRDFAMNDRCAAGTGRFLEVVAQRLDVQLSSLGEMARKSTNRVTISSMCVVFAETEIIGLLAAGTTPEDIVAGVQSSLASRVAGMAGRNVSPPVIFTGGVALVPGMKDALREALGSEIHIAPDPQMTGALGAAILAANHIEKKIADR